MVEKLKGRGHNYTDNWTQYNIACYMEDIEGAHEHYLRPSLLDNRYMSVIHERKQCKPNLPCTVLFLFFAEAIFYAKLTY